MMNSSPSQVTSGLLKCANDANIAIDAQSKMFPSWLITFISTLKAQTFSFVLIHNDSRSTALESFTHFSNNLFSLTDNSDCLPGSKCGAANGFNSIFIFKIPSLGLDDFGCWISQDVWAKTLHKQ